MGSLRTAEEGGHPLHCARDCVRAGAQVGNCGSQNPPVVPVSFFLGLALDPLESAEPLTPISGQYLRCIRPWKCPRRSVIKCKRETKGDGGKYSAFHDTSQNASRDTSQGKKLGIYSAGEVTYICCHIEAGIRVLLAFLKGPVGYCAHMT